VIASIFIIVVSMFLFVYWFRYTCLLILSTRINKEYAEQIARANQLNFLRARDLLLSDSSNGAIAKNALDTLHRSLDRDYTLLTYLLRHAGQNADTQTFEQHMLRADFQLMRIWYALAGTVSPAQARVALLEMASIVNHLASDMGERVATSQNV
jgi:hypothetical protein